MNYEKYFIKKREGIKNIIKIYNLTEFGRNKKYNIQKIENYKDFIKLPLMGSANLFP